MQSSSVSSGVTRLAHALDSLRPRVGNTPLWQCRLKGVSYSFKVEWQQLGGSIKMRAALHMLAEMVGNGILDRNSIVIESSSGNFAVGLSISCHALGLPFFAVVDPNLSENKKQLLSAYGAELIRVTDPDETGGYLLNRLRRVAAFIESEPRAVNPNQYNNGDNPNAYYLGLGPELQRHLAEVDAVFISVSSGGTLAGLSRYIKETTPHVAVVAVDVQGSLVFETKSAPRRLSGIGAGLRSEHIGRASIDHVMILSEYEIIEGFRSLLKTCAIFGGISTGAAFAAAQKAASSLGFKRCLIICPDGGNDYLQYL